MFIGVWYIPLFGMRACLGQIIDKIDCAVNYNSQSLIILASFTITTDFYEAIVLVFGSCIFVAPSASVN